LNVERRTSLINSYQRVNASGDFFGIDLIFLDELDVEAK
jgi:hypothetical protein